MIPTLCSDALVVGGGPAGAILATILAKEGRQTILIERSREAEHKVCGEFISPECLPFLRRVDLDPERLGAHTIRAVRVAARDVIAEASLPVPALALTRRTLDEELLRRAQGTGVHVLRGYAANHLKPIENDSGQRIWRAEVIDRSRSSFALLGKEAFLATGKHDLRGWSRSTSAAHNDLVALKMYFALSPQQKTELDGNVELILYPDGYAGLQPVEHGSVNLCALITHEKFRLLEGRWERLLEYMQSQSPHLEKRLSGARATLNRPLAISSIPYGYCCVPMPEEVATPWRIGDQAAVIPSFCGDGLAIALHTAHRAARLYLEGSNPAVFHAEVRRQFQRRLYWSSMLSRLLIARPSISHAARLWPAILSELFAATRVPATSLASAGAGSVSGFGD